MGWLISRGAGILHECQEMKSYTTICGSAPSEILALIALENTETLAARCVGIVQGNIEIARAFLDRHRDHFRVHFPRAGTVALAELNAGMDVSDFAQASVERAGVMVLPARVMKFEGNYFRMGFGTAQSAACAGSFRGFRGGLSALRRGRTCAV